MRSLVISTVVAIECLTAATVSGQAVPSKMPDSTHIFPAGGRRGTVVPVRIGGECIPPGTTFDLSGDGLLASATVEQRYPSAGEPSPRRLPTEVAAYYPKEWVGRIKIDANAPIGPAWWRLSCASGGTASRPFVVGDLPEWIETESNSVRERAEDVEVPVSINGQIFGERDLDYFRFEAAASQVIAVEVLARRLGSRLDPIVEIVDESGNVQPTQRIQLGEDPALAFSAAQPGHYLLRVANVSMHGSPAHVYRINVTDKPFVYRTVPSASRVGTTRVVEFLALSGRETPRVIRRDVSFPDVPGTFTFHDPEGELPPVTLRSVSAESVVERESTATGSEGSVVSVPSVFSGLIEEQGDTDQISFTVNEGAWLHAECRTAGRYSRLLPSLTLLDAGGAEFARVLGVEQPDGICSYSWQATTTDTVTAVVADIRDGSAGGEDYAYEFSVTEVAAGASLLIDTDCCNLVQGGNVSIPVRVVRQGGFNGEIPLRIEGLPADVDIENSVVPEGKDETNIVLKAGPEVPADSYRLRIVGEIVSSTAEPTEITALARHRGYDSEGMSVGPGYLDEVHLTVMYRPLFRLYCLEYYQYTPRGSIYPYRMEIERLDYDGPVTLQISDRQNRDLDGIEMIEVTIPPGESEIDLPIYLPESMHINVQSQSQLYCQGYTSFVDANGRNQAVMVVSEKRNMLRSTPPVVKLESIDDELSVATDETVHCRLKLARTSNFTGPMELTLESAPDTVQCEPLTIEAGQVEVDVALRITGPLPRGEVPLTFRAVGDYRQGIRAVTETTVRLVLE